MPGPVRGRATSISHAQEGAFVTKALGIALVIASLLARNAQADVLVVDAAGGAPFTAIQPAVDAAVDGDTILIKQGDYVGFTIGDKALAVVGDVGVMPAVAGRVRVANLAGAKTLTLARLRVRAKQTPADQRIALEVDDCAGAVRAVACVAWA